MPDIKSIPLSDKSGRALLPVIEDMRGRENAVVICNFGADDPSAPLSAHLLAGHAELLAGGLKALAGAAGCSEVLLYAAETDVQALCAALQDAGLTASAVSGPASPVLREPTALYTVMEKGLIRTGIAELEYRRSFLSQGWQNRPTLTVDAETAYAAGRMAGGLPAAKHVAVIGGETKIMELPLGSALSEALGEPECKAVLLGGVAGSFLPPAETAGISLQHVWEHDAAELIGPDVCPVARTAALYDRIRDLSCAKCVMCREGSWQLSAIFGDMTAGKAGSEDIALIGEIAPLIEKGAICEFGHKMVRPALTATAVFSEAFNTHIETRLCEAGQCAGLMRYVIDPARCTGCGECLDVCPEDAITGEPDFIHMINENYCSRCGRCAEACPSDAVLHTGSRIKVPRRLTRVGRFR